MRGVFAATAFSLSVACTQSTPLPQPITVPVGAIVYHRDTNSPPPQGTPDRPVALHVGLNAGQTTESIICFDSACHFSETYQYQFELHLQTNTDYVVFVD